MNYFQMIMALIGVLALVFVIFWVMKKFNARVTLTDTRHLKVLERVNLGPDKMLLIVSVCGKCMLLGVTSQSTEKICDLDETEEQLCAKQADKTFPTFTESFKSILGKKKAASSDNGENNLKVTLDDVKVDENKNRQNNQENVGDTVKIDEKSNQNDSENNEKQE